MKTRGFTLVEIMVVTVIIGMLAALAFPLYAKVRMSTVKTLVVNDAGKVASAAQRYFMDKGVVTVATSTLVGPVTGAIKTLSPGNALNVNNMECSETFTFVVTNSFMTAGGLTFDQYGAVISDPY